MAPQKATLTLLFAALVGSGSAAWAIPSGCSDSDPGRVLANVSGDFELTADPQDSGGNLLYIANSRNGAGNLVIARIDGSTGNLIAGSLTTLATNWNGKGGTNGPEFVQKPTGELGVIYRASNGVNAVFRASPPTSWNAFGPPSRLPATLAGNYAGAGMIFKQNSYSEFKGGIGYGGSLAGGQLTNLQNAASAEGLSSTAAAQSPRDGYIFFSAVSPQGNGLYEAKINPSGGFVPGSVIRLAVTDTTVPKEGMRAERHPVTGRTVLFTNASTTQIAVWDQPESGGPLTKLATVGGNTSGHYRAETDRSSVVLHYYDRSNGASAGYTLRVNGGVGTSKRISEVSNGSELVWFPVSDQWALFYRNSGQFTRCLVDP